MMKGIVGTLALVLGIAIVSGIIVSQSGLVTWPFMIFKETEKVTVQTTPPSGSSTVGPSTKAMVEQKYTCEYDQCELIGHVEYTGGKTSSGYQYELYYHGPVMTTCTSSCENVVPTVATGSTEHAEIPTSPMTITRGGCAKVCSKFGGYGSNDGGLPTATAWISYKATGGEEGLYPDDPYFVPDTGWFAGQSYQITLPKCDGPCEVTIPCTATKCKIEADVKYRDNVHKYFYTIYVYYYDTEIIDAGSQCSKSKLSEHTREKTIKTTANTISGRDMKLCYGVWRDGIGLSGTVSVSGYYPKCQDPYTAVYLNPVEEKIYSGGSVSCSGPRCTQCPNNLGYEYCKVKCTDGGSDIYGGIVKAGDTKITYNWDTLTLGTCKFDHPLGTYDIYGWRCPEVTPPTEETCGNAELDSDEECDWAIAKTENSACTGDDNGTSGCEGKRYKTVSTFGNCNMDCTCTEPQVTYTCDESQCGASCSSGDWDWCTTADGYKGKKQCDDSTCGWTSCTRTAECKLDPQPEERCMGNSIQVCTYDSQKGAVWHTTETCPYGCSDATCNNVCGDGSVNQPNEECDPSNQQNSGYCQQETRTCSGRKVGTRDQYGNCDSVCACKFDAYSYSCSQGECNAQCSDGYTEPCTTADGIPGEKRCLDDCTMSTTCYQTGVCKPESRRCAGDFVEVCAADGSEWQTQYPACDYGCTNGYCDKICGDNSKNQPWEECDPPAVNSGECPQTQSECSGNRLGTRDAYGNCNSGCACDLDDFTYSCVKDQCGAACNDGEVDTTCTVNGVPGERYCQSDCTWGTCQQTGVCVPGETAPCGDCGIKTCSSNGAWGECKEQENLCGDGYVCNPK